MIWTQLCDMVGIRYPLIQAGMGPFGTNKLAAAAANAGALGIMSTSGFGSLTADLSKLRPGVRQMVSTLLDGRGGTWEEQVKRAFRRVGAETKETGGIFGINVMVAVEMRTLAGNVIKAALEVREEDPDLRDRLKVVITSAGDPLPWTDVIKPSGLKWFHVVPSVKHAQRAERAGVDAVIASGQEGGGHVAWEPVHTIVLLPAIAQAVNVPVIGAGGFADGRSLVAALALGAIGVQMGTRFLATIESEFPETHKEFVLKGNERDTQIARGYVGPLRYVKNEAAVDFARLTAAKAPGVYLGVPDDLTTVAKEVMAREDEGWDALYRGDGPNALMPGGEAAGRVHDVPTVAELVGRIAREAEEAVRNMPGDFLRD
jgi:enoyl-[acyl-carrier protein] reductase II